MVSTERINVIISLIKEIQDNIKEIEKTQVRHDIALQSIDKLEKKDKELSERVDRIEEPVKMLKTVYSWMTKIVVVAGGLLAFKQLLESTLSYFKK